MRSFARSRWRAGGAGVIVTSAGRRGRGRLPARPAAIRRARAPSSARVAEELLALAEDDRKDHQPELVHEALLDELVHEATASVDEDDAVLARPSAREVVRRRSPSSSTTPGSASVEETTNFGIVLNLSAKSPSRSRPRGREALVGHPAEEERRALHHLVQLELVSVLAPVELEGPASALQALGAAGVLHDPVDRDELRYDDPTHD